MRFRKFLLYYGETYFKKCGWYNPADWKQKLQSVFGSKAGQGQNVEAKAIAAAKKAELEEARGEGKGKKSTYYCLLVVTSELRHLKVLTTVY